MKFRYERDVRIGISRLINAFTDNGIHHFNLRAMCVRTLFWGSIRISPSFFPELFTLTGQCYSRSWEHDMIGSILSFIKKNQQLYIWLRCVVEECEISLKLRLFELLKARLENSTTGKNERTHVDRIHMKRPSTSNVYFLPSCVCR